MITAIIRRLGAAGYRLAFLAAGIYLLLRAGSDSDSARSATSLGLGSLCLLQFGLLAIIDWRRLYRRNSAGNRRDRWHDRNSQG